jgi:chloramphenicol-sensitive protein RarD
VARGVAASVLASCLFAVMFYYVTLMKPLTGGEVFGWRMLFNAPCITLLLVLNREWVLVRDLLGRMRRQPALVAGVVACTCFVGTQLWLFLWAPLNGRALDVALGFLLLPLGLILVGRVVFGERLTPAQHAASLLAVAGVANEVVRVGSVSWVTGFVAIGYPIYFALRRKLGTNHQGGMWIEMHLIVPFAVLLILTGPNSLGTLADHPALLVLIPGLGLMSAVALTAYYLASHLLRFGLFGLMGYLEPVLLVTVALLLGERIAPGQWLTYIPISLALAVLFGDGVRRPGLWRSFTRRRELLRG